MSFEVRRLTLEDKEEVLNLIVEHYSKDYYPNWIGLKSEELDIRSINRVNQKLKQKYSIGIFDKSANKLVGVSLNEVQERKNLLNSKKRITKNPSESEEIRQITKFFQDLEDDIYDQLQVDRIFYTGMGTIHKDYRNRGLISIYEDEMKRMLLSSGCKYLVTTSTNEFMYQKLLKSGCTLVREVKYLDYFKKTGFKIFENTKYPYIRAAIFYKHINQFNNSKL